MSDEEIKVSPLTKLILVFIIGLLIGGSVMTYYESNLEYRSPSELADYIEEFAFNHSHMEEIQHSQIKTLLTTDSITIGQIKESYKFYGQQARYILESQLNAVCYKKQWKD